MTLIMAYLIDSVTIKRGYEVQIKFSVAYDANIPAHVTSSSSATSLYCLRTMQSAIYSGHQENIVSSLRNQKCIMLLSRIALNAAVTIRTESAPCFAPTGGSVSFTMQSKKALFSA